MGPHYQYDTDLTIWQLKQNKKAGVSSETIDKSMLLTKGQGGIVYRTKCGSQSSLGFKHKK